MKTIGTHYRSSDDTRVETMEYYEEEIRVLANVYDDRLSVVQEMPDTQGIDGTGALYRLFRETTTAMAVLEGLGYDLDFCDDGVAFWSKAISK